MYSKIVLCTILYLCVQVNGETAADVLAELQPKISELQNQIGLIIGNDRRQLGITRELINQAANVAQTGVNVKLNDLHNLINGLDATNPNVQNCVNSAQAALNGLDLNGIRLCRISRDLDLVGVQLSDLGTVNARLGRVVGVCSSQHPEDVAGLRSCIEGGISDYQGQSSAIDANIRGTLDNALAQAVNCVDSASSNLNNGLDGIVADLKTCVSN